LSLTLEQIQASFEAHGLGSYWTLPQIKALSQFTQKMLEINETLNLTRWVQDEDVLNFHLLDSALVLPVLKPILGSSEPNRWLDLGTGCGFPGSVVRPWWAGLKMAARIFDIGSSTMVSPPGQWLIFLWFSNTLYPF
jgi:16S rRNA G527 N7-methylase RsmG